MWDLTSLTRGQTLVPALDAESSPTELPETSQHDISDALTFSCT